MRMHKSKDYRSEQKKQKYERKRRNAKNMLYFIDLSRIPCPQ